MAKLGISIKIDVTKIDKSRIFEGQKGKYIDLTTFIDTDNPDQYENHGLISQSTNKQEREAGVQTPILGNCKVFYSDLNGGQQAVQNQMQQPQQAPQMAPQQPPVDSFDDDIPF